MDLRNCVRCGKLFPYTTKPICEACVKQEEEDFIRIKDIIGENPGISVSELAEMTGISVNRILKHLKEGRLQLSTGTDMLKCERCGTPILTGKFCESCLVKLKTAVNELFPEGQGKKETSSDMKMYSYKEKK